MEMTDETRRCHEPEDILQRGCICIGKHIKQHKHHRHEYSSVQLLLHTLAYEESPSVTRDTTALVFHIPNTKELCNIRTVSVSQTPVFTLRDFSVTSAAASVPLACIKISVNTHPV